MKKSLGFETICFNIVGYAVLLVFTLICLIPFWLALSGSFTDENIMFSGGLSLIPAKVSLKAYQMIFEQPSSILRAYGVTALLVLTGTVLSLFINSMTAYVLQRKSFVYKNGFTFFFYFTTLFSGGLVPFYILITELKLRDTFFVLLIPYLLNVFYLIIIKTYFKTNVSDSMAESAQIDGAREFKIFYKIYLPLAQPVLATIGLFVSLNYWNDWYTAMLYINNPDLFPLQYFLYKIFNSIMFTQLVAERTGQAVGNLPTEAFKYAMTMVTIGPVILVYPFIQKYLIKGITVGSVKE